MHTTILSESTNTRVHHNSDWSGEVLLLAPTVRGDGDPVLPERVMVSLTPEALAILVVTYMAECDGATKAVHDAAVEMGRKAGRDSVIERVVDLAKMDLDRLAMTLRALP